MQLLAPVAGFFVSLRRDGTVRAQGEDLDVVLGGDVALAAEAQITKEELEIASQEVPQLAKKEALADGKLVVAEEIAQGRVSRKAYQLYFSTLGGDYPLIFHSLWIFAFLFADAIKASQTWFLGLWGTQYERNDPSDVPVAL